MGQRYTYADAWNRSLTDDDSAYLEIQSGPFESQTMYKFLKPHQKVEWSEYWYAVPELDGLHYAEKEAAVWCEFRETSVAFRLSAVRRLDGCEIKLTVGGQTYRKELDLSAEHVAEVAFELPDRTVKHLYRLEIRHEGTTILAMGERDESMPIAPDIHLFEDARVVRQPEREHTSKLDLGQYKESFGLLEEAISFYQAHLQDNSRCTVTLVRLGQIYLKQLRFDEAISCFETALRCDNRNSKARFLLGVAEQSAGRTFRARKLFEDIAVDSEMYECSLIEWVKTDMALGHYHEALTHIGSAGFESPYLDLIRRVCERVLGVQKGRNARNNPRDVDSRSGSTGILLGEYGLAESWLASGSEEDRTRFAGYTGGDERVHLPIALFYAELGMLDDASRVLEQVRKPGLKSALARLLLIRLRSNDDVGVTAKQIEEALMLPLDYVFLNETPLVAFLMEISDLDSSGRLDYLLGTFFYSVERKEMALKYSLSSYGKQAECSPAVYGSRRKPRQSVGSAYENIYGDRAARQGF